MLYVTHWISVNMMEKTTLLPVLLLLAVYHLGVLSLRECRFPDGLDAALKDDMDHVLAKAADDLHPALQADHVITEYFSRAFCKGCVCSGCDYGQDSGVHFVTRVKKLNDAHDQLRLAADKLADEIIHRHHPWDVKTSLHPHLDSASDPCLLVQKDYVTMYSNRWHLPIYVSYHLRKAQLMAGEQVGRKDCFRRDIRLDPSHDESAMCEYYKKAYHGSQYLRGHMAPSADMRHDSLAELNAGVLSNVAPTTETFEDTVWGPMEDKAREWAKAHGTVFVISGTILEDIGNPTWMKTQGDVAVPDHLFKVIVRCTTAMIDHILKCPQDGLEAIVFIHPNTPNTEKQELKQELNSYQAEVLEKMLDIALLQLMSPGKERTAMEKGLTGKSGVKTLLGNYLVSCLPEEAQAALIKKVADKGLGPVKDILGVEGFGECTIPDQAIKGQVKNGGQKALSALGNVFGCYMFSSTPHLKGDPGKKLAASISNEAQAEALVHYLKLHGYLVSLDKLRDITKIKFLSGGIPPAQFHTPDTDVKAALPGLQNEIKQVVDSAIQKLKNGLAVHEGL